MFSFNCKLLNILKNSKPLFNLVINKYSTQKKTSNKSFLLDFGYVESVGSV
jgi:hypothetical protein